MSYTNIKGRYKTKDQVGNEWKDGEFLYDEGRKELIGLDDTPPYEKLTEVCVENERNIDELFITNGIECGPNSGGPKHRFYNKEYGSPKKFIFNGPVHKICVIRTSSKGTTPLKEIEVNTTKVITFHCHGFDGLKKVHLPSTIKAIDLFNCELLEETNINRDFTKLNQLIIANTSIRDIELPLSQNLYFEGSIGMVITNLEEVLNSNKNISTLFNHH